MIIIIIICFNCWTENKIEFYSKFSFTHVSQVVFIIYDIVIIFGEYDHHDYLTTSWTDYIMNICNIESEENEFVEIFNGRCGSKFHTLGVSRKLASSVTSVHYQCTIEIYFRGSTASFSQATYSRLHFKNTLLGLCADC